MGLAVVTGANRGIGLALVRQLRARGMSVVAVCRRASSDLERLGVPIESASLRITASSGSRIAMGAGLAGVSSSAAEARR